MIQQYKFTEENFFTWLASRVSSAKLSDLYKTFTEIERYCKKKGLVSNSIYTISDINEITRLEKKIAEDKLLWMTNRGLNSKMQNAFPYYIQYIKKVQEENDKRKEEQDTHIDEVVNSILIENETSQNQTYEKQHITADVVPVKKESDHAETEIVSSSQDKKTNEIVPNKCNTRDGSLCQMYFLTIPKLEPVSRLTCRMEPPACRSAANASAF